MNGYSSLILWIIWEVWELTLTWTEVPASDPVTTTSLPPGHWRSYLSRVLWIQLADSPSVSTPTMPYSSPRWALVTSWTHVTCLPSTWTLWECGALHWTRGEPEWCRLRPSHSCVYPRYTAQATGHSMYHCVAGSSETDWEDAGSEWLVLVWLARSWQERGRRGHVSSNVLQLQSLVTPTHLPPRHTQHCLQWWPRDQRSSPLQLRCDWEASRWSWSGWRTGGAKAEVIRQGQGAETGEEKQQQEER